jgi:hypothetical protein
MPVRHLDEAPHAEWRVADPVMDSASRGGPARVTHRAKVARHSPGTTMTRTSAYCVVVAIGHGDQDSYRPALQLAAREARQRGLAIKLVHGSVEDEGSTGGATEAGARTRRGRRILNAAAREMRELVDDQVRIYTNNSPLTAVDALLGESLTAPLIVLQRTPSTSREAKPPGATLSVVAAEASCPVALAPSGNAGRVSSGVVMRMEQQDRSALARSEAWDEAALRRVPLTVEHAWDGPFSRTPTSNHLPPSRKERSRERERDLRRLADLITAMETSSSAAELNQVLLQATR